MKFSGWRNLICNWFVPGRQFIITIIKETISEKRFWQWVCTQPKPLNWWPSNSQGKWINTRLRLNEKIDILRVLVFFLKNLSNHEKRTFFFKAGLASVSPATGWKSISVLKRKFAEDTFWLCCGHRTPLFDPIEAQALKP